MNEQKKLTEVFYEFGIYIKKLNTYFYDYEKLLTPCGNKPILVFDIGVLD